MHSGSDTSNDRAPRPPGAIAQPAITEGSDAATDASAVRKEWRKSEDKDRAYQQTNGRYKKNLEGPFQFLFKTSESLGLILYNYVSDIF